MPNNNRKGVILFIVLAVIILVVSLSTVILRIMLSQASLTHHQVSRIQAQYVARAGVIYAAEMLRTGSWTFSPVNSCPNSSPCVVSDTNFPTSVVNQQARVIFCPSGSTCQYSSSPCSPPTGSNFCINSTAVFTPPT
jgi:Tfp pilus assembly protein PilX